MSNNNKEIEVYRRSNPSVVNRLFIYVRMKFEDRVKLLAFDYYKNTRRLCIYKPIRTNVPK